MKIFTASQIRACDAYTIKAGAISSIELMERAAGRCVAWIKENLPKDSLFVVLCGTGNNGGDGLAIARMLHQKGYGVKAFLLQFSNVLSPDCENNLHRLQAIDSELVSIVPPDTFITDIPKHIIIIDALLGTGLNRPVEGWLAEFIKHTNILPNRKIAIDIPSGLPSDVINDPGSPTLKVSDTLSFQFYKRTFLHPESGILAGNIHILDIGLDRTFINATGTLYKTIDQSDIIATYHPRNPFTHKGDYGKLLLVGGSYGKMGAITLSARAALRAGAGMVTALVPGCGYTVLQTAAPEVMCTTSGEHFIKQIEDFEQYTIIGIGPGLGTESITAHALTAFLDHRKAPVVLDADALNLIACQPELLVRLPKGSIITPHPKEFSRLFGESHNSMIQLDYARIQAMRYNINIVLKGHHTAIVTSEGECWYNLTGNAGMAKGGSGDVLTGIITGLLAQGYKSADAAVMGVYLHGLAADIAIKDIAQEALIASDIIDNLGKAFMTLAKPE